MLVSCGVDPGTANYSYSYLQCQNKRGSLRLKILSTGMLHWTISNLTDSPQKPIKSKRRKKIPIKDQMVPCFSEQQALFEKDWRANTKLYAPTLWAVERFQIRRGGSGGKTIECVSMMNGILAALARRNKITFNMITAAQWKNRVNPLHDLESIYKEVNVPDHVVDANFIALYQALKHFEMPWEIDIINQLIDQLSELSYNKVKA